MLHFVLKASEIFDVWDCIKKFDRQLESYLNHEPSQTLRHFPHNRTREEVETETTFESTKRNVVTPVGIKLNPRYGTGEAWDNFDRFIEIIPGKATLHSRAVGSFFMVVGRGGGLSKNVSHHCWLTKKNLAIALH